ncbi:MAG TPA: putative baseplate assembly protein [Acidimicrobiales bacterium]|nr:putative baseplate assembly protein [Acidimicrobiales bacterium]
MPLPVPNLDDRRFQDYVDDAKRYVQQNCPEWTDHNVSDPGVTLIETFAFMIDQLTYRLNLVPDRNYLKFLELIGVRLFPPSAAQAPVTFWLSSPQTNPVVVPRGSRVQTQRVDREEPIVFETLAELTIQSSGISRVVSHGIEEFAVFDHTDRLELEDFDAFGAVPIPGEALLIGLSEAAPSNVVALRFRAHVVGVGVDPENPPLAWEAFDGTAWHPCELERDETGGLNQPGDIILHVPPEHDVALIDGQRAGWLRCRVTQPDEGQPFYSASPRIETVSAFVIGGTTTAVHAQVIDDELIGISEGVAGQSFQLRQRPVVSSSVPHVLEVAGGDGWEEWTEVDTFAASDENDRHFILDRVAGEIVLGPVIRLEDGSTRNYGHVPPKGAPLRLRQYRSGGGEKGNVSRGVLATMKTQIPFIARVENRLPAGGGVEGEELENAKVRGPISLRTLGRAVTVEDYEILARQSAAGIARVRCVPATEEDPHAGVRILVVPAIADDADGTMPFTRLAPAAALLEQVAVSLDQRRAVGARVVVEPPFFQGVTVVAQVRARSFADPGRVRLDAATALYHFLHPIHGGADGAGWPFGRPVHAGEVYAVLQRVGGVELVEAVQLYPADPVTGERGLVTQRLEIAANALLFSYGHEVRVIGP